MNESLKSLLREGVHDKMIAKLREIANYKNAGDGYDYTTIKRALAAIDAATTRRELEDAKKLIYDLPQNMKGYTIITGKWEAYWALHQVADMKEREINKAAKEAKVAAVTAKKAEKEAAVAAKAATVQRHLELPALKKVVDTVVSGFKQEIIDWHTDMMTEKVKKYFPKGNYTPPKFEGKYDIWNKDHQRKKVQIQRIEALLRPFVEWKTVKDPSHYSGKSTVGKLKKDWKQMIENQAEDIAEQSIMRYKGKLSAKLGEVIDRKGGKAKISVTGTQMNHSIVMKFDDKSGFTIQTKQVLAVSVNGLLFARWPTTFHDVTFSDGTKMKTPSSQKLQDEFGISDLSIDNK